jgi:hypothetical protein
MAILKIDQIFLYTGLCAKGDDCWQAYQFLKEQGVDFSSLHYGDPIQHQEVHASMSTWVWHDGSTRTFQEFPYIHWREVDSDFNVVVKQAYGLEEIKKCSLFDDLKNVVEIKV